MFHFKFALPIFLLCTLFSASQTVDEIISKNIQARGGLEKLKSIQSLRITGHIETVYGNHKFVEERKRLNKLRIEVSMPAPFSATVEGYDGERGWQKMPGSEGPVDEDGSKAYEALADMDGPLVDYRQKGHTVELVGTEKSPGGEAYHLKVTFKNGSVRDFYLDSKTFLETKITKRLGIQDMEERPGDYREVNGIMMPFLSDEYSKITIEKSRLNRDQLLFQGITGDEGSHQKRVVEKIELNVSIDDSAFSLPADRPKDKKHKK